MHPDTIDEKIQQIQTEITTVDKAKKRLDIIKHHIEVLHNELITHKAKLHKEHEDVLRLEKTPAISLFNSILGDKEQRLEKERQEYLQVVLEYNALADEINLLKYEKDLLQKKLIDSKPLLEKLNELLKIKEENIIKNHSQKAIEIILINKEIDKHKETAQNFTEAIKTAERAKSIVQQSYDELIQVKRFGYSTMHGSGRYSSYAKKNYLDKALKAAVNINLLLNQLEEEMYSVYEKSTHFNIVKYQEFINTFYDLMIADYVTQNKLRKAIKCLKDTLEKIQESIEKLQEDRFLNESYISQKSKEKQVLVQNY